MRGETLGRGQTIILHPIRRTSHCRVKYGIYLLTLAIDDSVNDPDSQNYVNLDIGRVKCI